MAGNIFFMHILQNTILILQRKQTTKQVFQLLLYIVCCMRVFFSKNYQNTNTFLNTNSYSVIFLTTTFSHLSHFSFTGDIYLLNIVIAR